MLERSNDNMPSTIEEFQLKFQTILSWYLDDSKYDLTPVIAEQIKNGTTPPSPYAYQYWERFEFTNENLILHLPDASRVQAKTLLVSSGKGEASKAISESSAKSKFVAQ